MLKLKSYPVSIKGDRDVELPVFLEFVKRVGGKINSVLDVGCQFSSHYYAHDLRKVVGVYHGLDPIPDPDVEKIVDNYIHADACGYNFALYDLVVCLSVLEHFGHYPIKFKDFKDKRFAVFKSMLLSARKYLWFSIPVGQEFTDPGQMTIFDKEEFKNYQEELKPFKTTYGYFWSEGPQASHPWTTSTYDKVFNEPYSIPLGNRGICVVEVEK